MEPNVAPINSLKPNFDTAAPFSLSIPCTVPAIIPIEEKLAKLVRKTVTIPTVFFRERIY